MVVAVAVGAVGSAWRRIRHLRTWASQRPCLYILGSSNPFMCFYIDAIRLRALKGLAKLIFYFTLPTSNHFLLRPDNQCLLPQRGRRVPLTAA